MMSKSRLRFGLLVLLIFGVGFIAIGTLTVHVTALPDTQRSYFSATTPTPTPTRTITPTPSPSVTPTSMPGPPTLLAPENGALLPQPVPPDQWYFKWAARTGPCNSTIFIEDPVGRSIVATVDWWPHNYYEFVYTRTTFLPNDALGIWSWMTYVDCPLGHNHSTVYTFTVMLPSRFYLPVVTKDN